jgi:hypothetical protein
MGVITALAAVTLSVFAVGAAFAASGGGYTPPNQNCQPTDSDYATPKGQTYAGCHDQQISVESGQTKNGDVAGGNTHYVDEGINQEPLDPNTQTIGFLEQVGQPGYAASPHSGCVGANTDGTGSAPAPASATPTDPGTAGNASNGCGDNPKGFGFTSNWDYYQVYCPVAAAAGHPCEDKTPGTTTFTPHTGSAVDTSIVQNGLLLYFGADDNLDAGEHDGLGPYSDLAGQNNNGAHNGSSDGGAMILSVTPQNAANTPSQTHPEGLANYSLGFCADGICIEGTTQQQTVYNGCNAPDANGHAPCTTSAHDGNVYDYSKPDPAVTTESPNCSSGDAQGSSDATCGPGGMNAIRSGTPNNMNAEPGVQLYSDPDSQRSPAAPAPFWPTPAIYAGTCGVVVGSPALPTAAAVNSSPVGNGAGQVVIDPAPSQC